MVLSFDIFEINFTGDVLWRDAAESLVAARVSIEKLATSSPGEYLIFDQKTGHKVLVTLPGVSATPGSQALIEPILKPAGFTRQLAGRFRLDRRHSYKQTLRRTSK